MLALQWQLLIVQDNFGVAKRMYLFFKKKFISMANMNYSYHTRILTFRRGQSLIKIQLTHIKVHQTVD